MARTIIRSFHGDSTMNNTMSGRRSLLRLSTLATGLALLATSAMTPAVATAKNANGNHGLDAKALVGTWRVTVKTYPCANPNATNPAFVSLLTFGEDGSLIETTSSPQFQPGQRSTGHGFWERTGRGSYRAVSEAFIQFAPNPPSFVVVPLPPPPAPQLLRGRQRLDQGIQMTSRDTFVLGRLGRVLQQHGTGQCRAILHRAAPRHPASGSSEPEDRRPPRDGRRSSGGTATCDFY
ncbi:MAG: hypothetical protein MZV70_43040 [Desulfobacterales bacterium]|nr:hypothetical protein [Desulfobacterales bacterium]